jgi:hypothetical protein
MKKLLSGVKRALSSGPSSRGSGSRSGDNGSQDSLWSSSFVPFLTRPWGRAVILHTIHSTKEMEKYESLRHREFGHTRVYDVNLLERIGLDEELPTILQTIGWGKLYDEPRLGSCLLTLEFVMTFETTEKNRKSSMKFRLFGMSFGCDFSRFSELLEFSKSCLPESTAMRNFNKVEFSDAISRKSTRLRFSDIHNPSLRFLHRWMSFTLFLMVELCSITTLELTCLFAMVDRIKYTPIADIVNYFKNVDKMSNPIECTSMVTWIAMNLGCPKMANLAYIEGDVPVLGLDHFVHMHILCEEPNHSLSLLYGCKAIRYLTRAFDCTLVKVLHCSLIIW